MGREGQDRGVVFCPFLYIDQKHEMYDFSFLYPSPYTHRWPRAIWDMTLRKKEGGHTTRKPILVYKAYYRVRRRPPLPLRNVGVKKNLLFHCSKPHKVCLRNGVCYKYILILSNASSKDFFRPYCARGEGSRPPVLMCV